MRRRACGQRETADGREERATARVISRRITLASTGIVLLMLGVGLGGLFLESRPHELARDAAKHGSHVYITTTKAAWSFVIAGAGSILAAAGVSWFVARRAVEPLGRTLSRQRAFVADASHELRTPLAVLDARIQLLQRKLDPASPAAAQAQRLRRDSQTLIEIVNEMLAMTGDGEHHDAPVAEDLDVIARPRGVTITTVTDRGLSVSMGSAALRRCLSALLDNALQHSFDGSNVTVAVTGTDRSVIITVADEGPGITGIAPERIFDRFAHAPVEADPRLPGRVGHGIGLSLVRDLAARCGGSVAVKSTSAAGTTIALTLPRTDHRRR